MLNPLNFITKFIKSSNQKEIDRLQKITQKIMQKKVMKINLTSKNYLMLLLLDSAQILLDIPHI